MSTEEPGLHAVRSADVKYTPGPWKISHGGFPTDDGFSIATDNANARCVKVVCECWPPIILPGIRHREELQANARLIAAAPELLEALLGIVNGVDEYWSECNPGKMAAVHDAIRKATT